MCRQGFLTSNGSVKRNLVKVFYLHFYVILYVSFFVDIKSAEPGQQHLILRVRQESADVLQQLNLLFWISRVSRLDLPR